MAIKMNHEEMKNTKRREDRGLKVEGNFLRDFTICEAVRGKQKGQRGQKRQKEIFAFFALFALFASLFTILSQTFLKKGNFFWFEVSATRAQSLSSIVAEIREEALRANSSDTGRPLPLAGHWNLGQEKNGFSPSYQMKLIECGHHLLPWFLLPEVVSNPEDPRWIDYYEAPIKRAAELKLPIALVGTQ